jgi:iron(III) transport system ATP-binding protein
MTVDCQLIESRSASKRYGSISAVEQVSLKWSRGRITALLGPSGSGKTTLGEIFTGLIRPDEGRILVGSDDVTSWTPNRRGISLMPQEWELFPHLTILENVTFGLWASGATRAVQYARAKSLLSAVGLLDREEALPRELSGGQQQRVALARALAAPNAFVVLDEPFSSVDNDTRRLLRDLLSEESRSGRGILLITHDRADALALSSMIHCLANGRLVMSGSPNEVYSKPISLEAALLTGPAFLIPLSSELNSASNVGALETSDGLKRLPKSTSTITGTSVGSNDSFAIARPEWFRLSEDGISGLHGNVISSDYLGREYLITIKGTLSAPFLVYSERSVPLGETVSITLKNESEHSMIVPH